MKAELEGGVQAGLGRYIALERELNLPSFQKTNTEKPGAKLWGGSLHERLIAVQFRAWSARQAGLSFTKSQLKIDYVEARLRRNSGAQI